MIPRELYRAFYILGVLAGTFCWIVFGIESCRGKQVNQAVQKQSELKGAADVHAQAGNAEAAAAIQAGQPTRAASVEVDRLKAELAALKRKLAEARPTEPAGADVPVPLVVGGVEGGGVEQVLDLRSVVAKQDEIIKAQDVRFAAALAERDHWRAAYTQADAAFRTERDRSLQLEIALEAQKSITKAALWRGRIQGITVGLGAGYVAGRLR